jgi:hypothetical protein
MPPPPGWYPDPYIHNGRRYWDGYQWTGHVAASTESPVGPAVRPHGGRDAVSVAAFVTSLPGLLPVAIPLGIAGLVRTDAGRRSGRRLAVASLIICCVWLFGLVTAGLLAAFDSDGPSGSASASSSRPTSRHVGLTDLRTGQCIDLPIYVPPSQDWLDVVDCAVPHNAEVYKVGELAGGPYPGDAVVEDAVGQVCGTALVSFSGSMNSRLETYEVLPTRDTWDVHDRGYVCVAVDDDHDDTGSMANTG